MGTSYVFTLGNIEARFPTLAVEKEFAQAMGRGDTAGLTDREALHATLTQKSNRYLARQLCWVLTIEGIDTYILQPRDPADFELLVESLRPHPTPLDMDVVIGIRGGIAPPDLCNGLMVPIVLFEQIYSFDRDSLLKALPRPESTPQDQFEAAASELLDRVTQLADNAGATDEHRALNYLVVRYPGIYTLANERHGLDESLTSVDVRPSPLSGVRRIVDVIFTFTNRKTDVMERFFVRVDVTELFPFLVSKVARYTGS